MPPFATMENATQHQLRLASRMSRLGTETAFEVLNKAKALERAEKRREKREGKTGDLIPPTIDERPSTSPRIA